MAKIGVYTFSSSVDNYGQVFQYLATQEYLKGRGHDVFLLRLRSDLNLVTKLKILLLNLFRKLVYKKRKQTIFEKWREISLDNEKQHPRFFEDFRAQVFKICYNSVEEIEKSKFDVLVAGSDQIWGGVNPYAFLSFADNVKKIAIASSTGSYKFTNAEIEQVSNYLQSFSFVTTRENSGIRLCHAAGYKNCCCILDPTFLMPKETYLKYQSQELVENKRKTIFLYLLGGNIDLCVDDIYEFARKHNLDVRYVASQGREDNYEKVWATIPEWIGLMNSSDYVLTNSFHGVAMSIIFKKNFLAMPLVGQVSRMNERVYSLLDRFNLQSRMFSNDLSKIFDEVDYSNIDDILLNNKNKLDKLMHDNQL